MMQNIMMQSQNIMLESEDCAMGEYLADNCYYGGATYHQRSYQVDDYITDYQNFLRDAPLIAENLKPDSNGVISFKNTKLQ